MEPTELTLRAGRPDDSTELGRICYEAFSTISLAHGFPPDFPSVEVATGMIGMALSRPDTYSVVAEENGRVMGSNFLWEGDVVAGVGPITVDPEGQNASVGRRLMEAVIRRGEEQGAMAIRLVQAAFHNRSLSLYTKLGFNTVEPLSHMSGSALGVNIEGYKVRPMTNDDVTAADAVCVAVHGHSRKNEIAGAVGTGSAVVIEREGVIKGYQTATGFFGHAVAESNDDMKALIGAAAEPNILLPTRNSELMRWCLEQGMRVIQPMTLMSRGVYQEPRGAFLPSILF